MISISDDLTAKKRCPQIQGFEVRPHRCIWVCMKIKSNEDLDYIIFILFCFAVLNTFHLTQ